MSFNMTNTSAGVYFDEIDNSAAADLAVGGVVSLVMPMHRGKIGKNMKILASEFDDLIGTTDGVYWRNAEILRLLVNQANYVNFTRVGQDILYAGVMVTTYNNLSTTRDIGAGLTTLDTINFSTKDIMLCAARDGGTYGNGFYTYFEPDATDPDGLAFNVYIYKVGKAKPIKVFRGATLFYKKDDNGRQCFIEDLINVDVTCPVMFFVNPNHFRLASDPKYPAMNAVCGGAYDPNSPSTPHGQLMYGDDGLEIDIESNNATTAATSLALIMDGWENYRDWETTRLGIACDGGYAHPAIAALLDEIVQERQDAIAVNNVPVAYQYYADAIKYRQGDVQVNSMSFNLASSWSTLCCNDLKMRVTSLAREMWVPLSVAQAYVMLECDKDRGWLAPAGLNRGGLPWATEMRHPMPIDIRDILNDNQINFPIHFKSPMSSNDPTGIYLWNADTLNGTNSALDDIGVRRMIALITESCRASFLRYNFENNSDLLRVNIKTDLDTNVLQPVKDGRGLDWFESVCNTSNNSNQDIADGDLYVDVFLDPTRYTKRIKLNLNIAPTGQVSAVVSMIEKGEV